MAKHAFPRQLYSLIPALYPHLAEILQNANLTGIEFFALSYVKNNGQPFEDGDIGLPISDLRDILLKAGAYDSDSGARGFITNHLQVSKQFLAHRRMTKEEKERLFPTSGGYRDALVLTAVGHARLQSVNDQVEVLFSRALNGVQAPFLGQLLRGVDGIAGQVVKRLEDLASRK